MDQKNEPTLGVDGTSVLKKQEQVPRPSVGSFGITNLLEKEGPVSPKEARKILGIDYKDFTDTQLVEMVTLLNVIAKEFVQASVPEYIR